MRNGTKHSIVYSGRPARQSLRCPELAHHAFDLGLVHSVAFKHSGRCLWVDLQTLPFLSKSRKDGETDEHPQLVCMRQVRLCPPVLEVRQRACLMSSNSRALRVVVQLIFRLSRASSDRRRVVSLALGLLGASMAMRTIATLNSVSISRK